jgi:hypothetical protein
MIRLVRWFALFAGLVASSLGAAAAQELKPIKIGFQSGEINVILSYALGIRFVQGERSRC